MIRETVLTAAIAALVAALVLTTLQVVWVTPLILQAETYEQRPAPDPHEHEDHVHAAFDSAAIHDHPHDDEGWKPKDGWQRTMFTLAANLLLAFGYAMVLIAVYLLWREPGNLARGAIYGIGGFAVFFLAPSLGLPPELPGTVAADLVARQSWWLMVVVATAAGLLMLSSRTNWKLRLLSLVLIVAPHFTAAPHPEMPGSLAPEALQTQFRVASALSNAIFWLLLGLVSTGAFRRMSQGRVSLR